MSDYYDADPIAELVADLNDRASIASPSSPEAPAPHAHECAHCWQPFSHEPVRHPGTGLPRRFNFVHIPCDQALFCSQLCADQHAADERFYAQRDDDYRDARFLQNF